MDFLVGELSMVDINFYAQKITQLEGRRDLLKEQLITAEASLLKAQDHQQRALKIRAAVQNVASNTQKKIEFQISNLVSMALAAVFPDPYKFELRYITRRGKVEADLIFSKNGNETDDILANGGGGVADIASLALRIASWSLKRNRTVLILDEPTKFLHNVTYQEKASLLIKELSSRIGVQIIMVTDQAAMVDAADLEIAVSQEDGVSSVKLIKQEV
jgi:ABC-type cobalamin/Fe3+-siderophores transport system ATPase subunit